MLAGTTQWKLVIEYFSWKSIHIERGEDASPRILYLRINSLKIYKICFYYMPNLKSTKILKLTSDLLLLFTLYKTFWKKIGTKVPAPYSVWFLEKNISHVIFY